MNRLLIGTSSSFWQFQFFFSIFSFQCQLSTRILNELVVKIDKNNASEAHSLKWWTVSNSVFSYLLSVGESLLTIISWLAYVRHSLIKLQKDQPRILKRYNPISFPWKFECDVRNTLRAMLFKNSNFYKECMAH